MVNLFFFSTSFVIGGVDISVNTISKYLIIVGDRYRSGYNEEGILMMSLSDFLLGKGG